MHPKGVRKDLSAWGPGRHLSPTSGAVSQHRLTLGAKHPLRCSLTCSPGGVGLGWGSRDLPLSLEAASATWTRAAAAGLWHRAPIWWWLSPTSLLLLKPAPKLSPKHTKTCRSWRHCLSWGEEVAGAFLQYVGSPDTSGEWDGEAQDWAARK